MLEILILISGLWVGWLISPRRIRRTFLKPLIALILVLALVHSPLTATLALQGLTLWLPEGQNTDTEAIVVLGRGPDSLYERGNEVIRLWRSNHQHSVFVSGMSDSQPLVDYLKLNGVPDHRLSGENCSQSTRENALFTSAILQSQGIRRIVLVTDPPHMLRSLLWFEQFGFEVTPHLSPLPNTLKPIDRLILTSREYAALAYYWVTHRTQQHSQPDRADHPSETALERIADWECQIQQSSSEVTLTLE